MAFIEESNSHAMPTMLAFRLPAARAMTYLSQSAMSFEIWNNPLASGGQEAREIFSGISGCRRGARSSRCCAASSTMLLESARTRTSRRSSRSSRRVSPDERLRGPVEVVSGYVERHTGGTCFSLTYCLGSILSSAGYRCYPVMADMKRPNIHCALVVEMNERRYLVDPGYLVGEPVELAGKPVRIETTFGVVEIRPRQGERYDLFTLDGEDRKWRYTVQNGAPSRIAAFMRHWQDSFSLPMMNNLLLTRLTPQGHLYIKNHHLRMKGAQRQGEREHPERFRVADRGRFRHPARRDGAGARASRAAEAHVARAGSRRRGKEA